MRLFPALVLALLAIPALTAGGALPLASAASLGWPADVTRWGTGDGALVGDDSCPGTYEVVPLVLYDETATQGTWGVSFGMQPQAETFPLFCGIQLLGLATLEGSFDPATGGCFGGAPDDGAELCLTFVYFERETGMSVYATTFDYYGDAPGYHYEGYVQLAFVDANAPQLPPLASVPDWAPTGATEYGAGGGSLTGDSCPGPYTVEMLVYDQTASHGYWNLQFNHVKDPVSIATEACGSFVGGTILNGTFDPATGGCFGGHTPPDAAKVCLTFQGVEATTGASLYDTTIEDATRAITYSGTVRLLFVDAP